MCDGIKTKEEFNVVNQIQIDGIEEDKNDEGYIITQLKNHLNDKDGESSISAKDMLYQIKNNRFPLKSLLNPDELERRRKIIEGPGGCLETTSNRLKNTFKIKDMKDFGIDSSDEVAFENMKKSMLAPIENKEIDIEYYDKSDYETVTGFHGNNGTSIIVSSFSNYKDDQSFRIGFQKTLIHELLHIVQSTGYNKFLDSEIGFAKEIYGDNPIAKDFLNGMFCEGGSISLSNSTIEGFEPDNYGFSSVIGINYLFYGRDEGTDSNGEKISIVPYRKIFSKLRYFGEIEEHEKKLLVDYLKDEFSKEPIKSYLIFQKEAGELIKPTDENIRETQNKIYNQLKLMVGKEDFFKKVYQGANKEETFEKFKQVDIEYLINSKIKNYKSLNK